MIPSTPLTRTLIRIALIIWVLAIVVFLFQSFR